MTRADDCVIPPDTALWREWQTVEAAWNLVRTFPAPITTTQEVHDGTRSGQQILDRILWYLNILDRRGVDDPVSTILRNAGWAATRQAASLGGTYGQAFTAALYHATAALVCYDEIEKARRRRAEERRAR